MPLCSVREEPRTSVTEFHEPIARKRLDAHTQSSRDRLKTSALGLLSGVVHVR